MSSAFSRPVVRAPRSLGESGDLKQVATRPQSTSAVEVAERRDSFGRRRAKSSPESAGGGSICPREFEEQKMRSWEKAEKKLTSTCFIAWSASVLLLAGSQMIPSWDVLTGVLTGVAVPATPVVALLGFAYVAFLYAPTRSTTSTPELLEPLRRRPSTSASPAEQPLMPQSHDHYLGRNTMRHAPYCVFFSHPVQGDGWRQIVKYV
ncbi:hypothetical protein T484DRAFT_3635333 [Baffinella frigidus]|nr:hypothetical protein T484DRAFT_3635333 [Cryptophyta sp. CCMP2293]